MTSKKIHDEIVEMSNDNVGGKPIICRIISTLLSLNQRLDLLESRLSTVQDDILRVGEHQTMIDKLIQQGIRVVRDSEPQQSSKSHE